MSITTSTKRSCHTPRDESRNELQEGALTGVEVGDYPSLSRSQWQLPLVNVRVPCHTQHDWPLKFVKPSSLSSPQSTSNVQRQQRSGMILARTFQTDGISTTVIVWGPSMANIAMKCLKNGGSVYYNYKGFHSHHTDGARRHGLLVFVGGGREPWLHRRCTGFQQRRAEGGHRAELVELLSTGRASERRPANAILFLLGSWKHHIIKIYIITHNNTRNKQNMIILLYNQTHSIINDNYLIEISYKIGIGSWLATKCSSPVIIARNTTIKFKCVLHGKKKHQ